MNKTRAEIVSHLVGYIGDVILRGEGAGLDADTPILELGIVNSLELVGLVAFVRESLGVELPYAELTGPNLETVRALSEFIERTGETRA